MVANTFLQSFFEHRILENIRTGEVLHITVEDAIFSKRAGAGVAANPENPATLARLGKIRHGVKRKTKRSTTFYLYVLFKKNVFRQDINAVMSYQL